MRIRILAVGEKMPGWVETASNDYLKRFPRDFSVVLKSVAAAGRRTGGKPKLACEQEGKSLLSAVADRDYVIALDVLGRQWSTEDLAEQVSSWRMEGKNVSLLIGGPEGLASECLDRADQRWSLSKLTLPHPMVRVLLLEQLYRAWSILNSHPYHR